MNCTGHVYGISHRIGGKYGMAARPKKDRKYTGLRHARRARGMTQGELADKAGTTTTTIVRLEKGDPKQRGMKLTREWAERFAGPLGYSADEIMFWDQRQDREHIESDRVLPTETEGGLAPANQAGIVEIDVRAGMGGGGLPSEEVRRDGNYSDPVKAETWNLPSTFVRNELRAAPHRLLVVEARGDSMSPTIASGERLIVDTDHSRPSPDGVFAIRDAFGGIVVKRLQVMRASKPPRIRVISDNPHHLTEDVGLEEIHVIGRVIWTLRRI